MMTLFLTIHRVFCKLNWHQKVMVTLQHRICVWCGKREELNDSLTWVEFK